MEYTCNPKIISIAFFSLLLIACFGQASTPTNQTFELNEIRAYLNEINKPTVKSIQSPDGDIIDCVLFHQQPAFDHPLLKGQQTLHPVPKVHNNSVNESKSFQLWRKSGETCPEGTVPIRRTTEQDILRVGSLRKFKQEVINDDFKGGDDVEWAFAYVQGEKYTGASAKLNIWSPLVSDNEEFSLSQIFVGAATNDQDVNFIRAGWIVQPSVFGDSRPRLFTGWNSKSTGCMNLMCPGYVHTNPNIAIGASFDPSSTYGGKQLESLYEIRQDINNDRWVLALLSSGSEVGYWPMSLFTHLNKGPAKQLQYGGAIRNKKSNGVHTKTQMGSGHWAEEGWTKAAYISNIKLADGTNGGVPYSAGLLDTYATASNCYNVKFTGNNRRWGSYIFFGGPGRNDNCP